MVRSGVGSALLVAMGTAAVGGPGRRADDGSSEALDTWMAAFRVPVARAWPDGAVVRALDDRSLELYRRGQTWSVPTPPRTRQVTRVCSDTWVRDYRGPATVAFAPDHTLWFFEPLDETVNVWRWEGADWGEVGAPQREVRAVGFRGMIQPDELVGPPAVIFDGEVPVVAWLRLDPETHDPREWTFAVVREVRWWDGAWWRTLESRTLPGRRREPPGMPRLELREGSVVVDGEELGPARW